MLKFYHLSNCDTCRKAQKFLRRSGHIFTPIPIRETTPSLEELRLALCAAGGDIRKLFNRSGKDFRSLHLEKTLPARSFEGAVALLQQNGNLIKRPFLAGKSFGVAGFDEEEWARLLAKL